MNKIILDLLVHTFDLEELRTLCFELGIPYDELGGEGLRGKGRELLLYAERHGWLPQLLTALRRERPTVDWPDLDASPADLGTPSERTHSGSTIIIGNMDHTYAAIGPNASLRVSQDEDIPPGGTP